MKNIEKGKKTGLKDFINMKLKKFKKYIKIWICTKLKKPHKSQSIKLEN